MICIHCERIPLIELIIISITSLHIFNFFFFCCCCFVLFWWEHLSLTFLPNLDDKNTLSTTITMWILRPFSSFIWKYPFTNLFLFSPLPDSGNHFSTLFPRVWLFLDLRFKWSFVRFSYFCVGHFTYPSVLQFHPCCRQQNSILF